MAENKTKQTDLSVAKYLEAIPEEQKRKDCQEVAKLMKQITKLAPKMWGTAIVGYGFYHYVYDSGHEGDSCLIGFSARKQNITLYLGSFEDKKKLMDKLGKHKTGKGCLYINKLSDVDRDVLKELIKVSYEAARKKHL